jgi:hypothetical protein
VTSLETINLEAEFCMAKFIGIKKRKRKQSSFTTLHGIIVSLAIGAFVAIVFLLVSLYWHPPE